MNRRELLLITSGGLSAAAGCVSPLGRPSPTPSPDVESRVEVPPCPTTPSPLAEETVGPFAVRFERAYLTREILRENDRVTYVEFLSIDESPTVTRVAEGFVVRFGALPAYGYRPHPGTPETAHADFPRYTAHYFVSGGSVRRATTTGEATADPREDGVVVHCPPR